MGSPKVSHTIMYLPLVPGDGTTPKSVFGTQFLEVKSPFAQSPMMWNTAVPAINRLSASSQSMDELSVLA